jgi:excisionase family DNA binding protein
LGDPPQGAGILDATRAALLAIPDFSRIFPSSLEGYMGADVMTLPEVARFLRLTGKTAYRLPADGTLPGFKVGGSRRFRKIDIDAWIEAKKEPPWGSAKDNARLSPNNTRKNRKRRGARRRSTAVTFGA